MSSCSSDASSCWCPGVEVAATASAPLVSATRLAYTDVTDWPQRYCNQVVTVVNTKWSHFSEGVDGDGNAMGRGSPPRATRGGGAVAGGASRGGRRFEGDGR